jgi:hypothetical protein
VTPLGARWPRIRAALIALFALVRVVEGCPTPRTSPATLNSSVQKAELETWTGLLARVGIVTTPEQLAATLVATSDELNARKRALLAPFRPFFSTFEVSQRWSLFPVADTHPVWMHIEARCRGSADFALAYRPNDPNADWQSSVLEYRRVRATWNPSVRGPRAAYPAFVDWVARRFFDDRPDCDAVRVGFLEMTLPAPGTSSTHHGDFVWVEQRTRAEVGR